MYRRIGVLLLMILCADMLYAGKFDRRVSALLFMGTDNSLVFEMRLYYDDLGNLVKMKQFDHMMKLAGYEVYSYDGNNVKARDDIFDSRREQQKYTLFQQVKNKRIATTYNMYNAVIMIIETEYDKQGAVRRIVEYSAAKELAAVSTYTYRGRNEIKCTRKLPLEEMSFYYIVRLDPDGMIESVEYFRPDGRRVGYVKVILENGLMTEQSLNDIIF